MPSNKFGSKFLGKERYHQYVDELTAEGTIAGEILSPEERKEGFKKRRNKISFESFVNKLLAKKKEVSTEEPTSSLSGSEANVKRPSAPIQSILKPPVSEKTQENLDDIMKGIDSILETLKEDQKLEKNTQKLEKKQKEKTKRVKKEEKLESKVFKGLTKTIDKVIQPVKSLFERLFNFLGTVLLGRVLVKFVDWFTDEKNKEKLNAIGRFLKDTWPALAVGILAFGTGIGRFITRLAFMIGKWTFKLASVIIPKLVGFIAKNPIASAALAAGVGAYAMTQLNEANREKENQKDDASTVTPAETRETGETPGAAQLQGEQIFQRGMGGMFAGGGSVPGSGNKDTVPAMLTPGEFVMSKGAVAKFGTDTLASMNTIGGGTNIPSFSDGGLLGYQGGGSVPNRDGTDTVKSNDESRERPNFGDWVMSFFRGGSTPKKTPSNKKKEEKGGMSTNAKALLNTIRWAEGTLKPGGYNTWFGGRNDINLSEMTVSEVVAEQKKRLSTGQATYGSYTSAAVGAYQMMEPEVFAKKAGFNPETTKFTPEVQDKMAIAGYMMGQASMTQAEIDAPISKGQIAKMAPVWASLPMMNGASRYGQPVKRYSDLVSVYNKNLDSLDPSSYSTSTTMIASADKSSGTGSVSSSTGGSGGSGSTGGSGGSGSTGGSGGSGSTGGGSPVPKTSVASLRQAINFKPATSAPSVGPPSLKMNLMIDDLRAAIDGVSVSQAPSTAETLNNQIPNISAAIMQSPSKVKTLGLTG